MYNRLKVMKKILKSFILLFIVIVLTLYTMINGGLLDTSENTERIINILFNCVGPIITWWMINEYDARRSKRVLIGLNLILMIIGGYDLIIRSIKGQGILTENIREIVELSLSLLSLYAIYLSVGARKRGKAD